MKGRLLLVLVIGVLIAAQDKKEKDDKEKLQGTWRAVSAEEGGKEDPKAKENTLTFDGDNWTIKENDKVRWKGTLKVDSTKKPKTIDMAVTEPPPFAGKTSLGIYELDGDNLKWCAAEPGEKERPKEFATKGTHNLMVVLKREKP
jgi:uncharacterized protein (TIGR03067 family)